MLITSFFQASTIGTTIPTGSSEIHNSLVKQIETDNYLSANLNEEINASRKKENQKKCKQCIAIALISLIVITLVTILLLYLT